LGQQKDTAPKFSFKVSCLLGIGNVVVTCEIKIFWNNFEKFYM